MDGFNLRNRWSLRNKTASLTITAYQGVASLCMFRTGGDSGKGPAAKLILGGAVRLRLIDTLSRLLKADPGTRLPFTQLDFDKNAGAGNSAWSNGTSWTFYKDENRVCHVEVQNRIVTEPEVFTFKSTASISDGPTPSTEEVRSTWAVKELIAFLQYELVTMTLLSTYGVENTFPNRSSGGGRGGYQRNDNRSNRNGGGGGNADPYGGSSFD